MDQNNFSKKIKFKYTNGGYTESSCWGNFSGVRTWTWASTESAPQNCLQQLKKSQFPNHALKTIAVFVKCYYRSTFHVGQVFKLRLRVQDLSETCLLWLIFHNHFCGKYVQIFFAVWSRGPFAARKFWQNPQEFTSRSQHSTVTFRIRLKGEHCFSPQSETHFCGSQKKFVEHEKAIKADEINRTVKILKTIWSCTVACGNRWTKRSLRMADIIMASFSLRPNAD